MAITARQRSCRPSWSRSTRHYSTGEDGGIAEQRLADLEAGRTSPVAADEATQMLGL
ncbi:MAG: hypothetical protein ACRDQ5_26245 [Sciscionella sp.]